MENDTRSWRWVIQDDLINEGGEKDMMGLYEVYAVNTKRNVYLGPSLHFVAKDEAKAKMKFVKVKDIDLDDDNILLFAAPKGQWESRKPKEVKIVKEE